MGFFSGLRAFFAALPILWEIVSTIARWIRENYEANERKKVAKEFSEAIKEQVQSLDNTRLNNLLNPQSEPFPVKKNEKPVDPA